MQAVGTVETTATKIAGKARPQPVAPPPDARLLLREHVAHLLQVSVETVSAMVAAGRIPVVRLGGGSKRGRDRMVRFERRAIEDWIRRGCPKAA